MKELIKNIITKLSLESKEILYNEFDFLFVSYGEKEDFFLFQFTDYNKLLEISEEVGNIEYLLNSIVKDIKKEFLFEYKERFLDNNLSLIVLLDTSSKNIATLSNLHKIEENYILTKKYVLNYNEDEFSSLKQMISNDTSIVEELNRLAIEHSEMLKSDDNHWYRLLLKLFIKIPFLNYSAQSGDGQNLYDLSETISKELDENQLEVLRTIDNEFNDSSNIEEFINLHNLTGDGE